MLHPAGQVFAVEEIAELRQAALATDSAGQERTEAEQRRQCASWTTPCGCARPAVHGRAARWDMVSHGTRHSSRRSSRRSFIRSAGARRHRRVGRLVRRSSARSARRCAAPRGDRLRGTGRGQSGVAWPASTSRRSATSTARRSPRWRRSIPQARQEVDFRRLFDHAGEFDAVVVSTTEHTHAFATLPALQLKKHVYCEKPLTLQRAGGARHPRGGGEGQRRHADGHADPRRRQLPPRRRAGAGRRHRPGARVPRLGRRAPGAGTPARPTRRPHKDIVFVQRPAGDGRCRCPPDLDWDLWLGPAPARPFTPGLRARARSGIAGGTSATAR